jgi:C_GCAxxG_C_C family probable redox protein
MPKDPLEARNKAGEYFRAGYNCSESVFLGFRDYLGLDMPNEMVRMMTVFGGGMGHAGCACGALTGSILILGLLRGMTEGGTGEKRDQAYALGKEFHDRFESTFGNTCCRNLNPYPHESVEHLKHCLKITGNSAKLLAEFMNDKGLTD